MDQEVVSYLQSVLSFRTYFGYYHYSKQIFSSYGEETCPMQQAMLLRQRYRKSRKRKGSKFIDLKVVNKR